MVRVPVWLRGGAMLAGTAVAWGGMFAVTKPLMGMVDPFTLTLLRYGVTAPVFLALLVLVEGVGALRLEGRGWRLWWLVISCRAMLWHVKANGGGHVVLWVRGRSDLLTSAARVAIVGARAATAYGERVAADMAGGPEQQRHVDRPEAAEMRADQPLLQPPRDLQVGLGRGAHLLQPGERPLDLAAAGGQPVPQANPRIPAVTCRQRSRHRRFRLRRRGGGKALLQLPPGQQHAGDGEQTHDDSPHDSA